MSRRDDLKSWERHRSAERAMDMASFGCAGLVAIGVASRFIPEGSRTVFYACALLMLALFLLTIAWLRTESAYLERRLTELEALIGNVTPTYYTSDDQVSYDENPLYERLDAIEGAIGRLSAR